jgi:hypothetical protein
MLIFSHNSCITLALLQVCVLQQFFCLKFTLYNNCSLHVQIGLGLLLQTISHKYHPWEGIAEQSQPHFSFRKKFSPWGPTKLKLIAQIFFSKENKPNHFHSIFNFQQMHIFATLDWRLYRYNALPKKKTLIIYKVQTTYQLFKKVQLVYLKQMNLCSKSCVFQGFSFDRRLDPMCQFLCIFHQEGVSLSFRWCKPEHLSRKTLLDVDSLRPKICFSNKFFHKNGLL